MEQRTEPLAGSSPRPDTEIPTSIPVTDDDKTNNINTQPEEETEETKDELPSENTKSTKRRGSAAFLTALTSAGGSVTRPMFDLCEQFLRPLSPKGDPKHDMPTLETKIESPPTPTPDAEKANATLCTKPRPTLVLKLDKGLRRGTLVRNHPGRAQVSVAVKVLQVNRLGQYLVHDGAKLLFVPPAQVIKPGEHGIRRLQAVKQAYRLFQTKDWRTLMQFCQKSLVEDFALF
jgi:hypothetical protein